MKESRQTLWFAIDLIMMVLLVVNLFFILFDTFFAIQSIQQFLFEHTPTLARNYQPIHENFLIYELYFIAVFLSEFLLRWIIAIRAKLYVRWYFFPFIHWYDLVGCIPIEAARIFRLLRVVSILYRLHKYQIIDLTDTAIYRFIRFYFDVFVEEVSDHVVRRVITDTQLELKSGSKVLSDIIDTVLLPRKSLIAQWVAETLKHYGRSISDPDSGMVIRRHIAGSVAKAIKSDPNVRIIKSMPVLGSNLEQRLETSVANIVIQSLINVLDDMDAAQIEILLNRGLESPSHDATPLDQHILDIVHESLEVIKNSTSEKRWKSQLQNQVAE